MTQRAMKLIKDIAELNDKLLDLENELKVELGVNEVKEIINKCNDERKEDYIKINKRKEDYIKINKMNEKLRKERIQTCIKYGEPIAEEDKTSLSVLLLPKDNFLKKLYEHGYGTIEDMFFNRNTRETTYNIINLYEIYQDINCYGTMMNWWYLYRELKCYDDCIIITGTEYFNISFDEEIADEYFNIELGAPGNDCGLSNQTVNSLYRAGINTIGDLLIIDDLSKFLKEKRGLGPKAKKEIHELLIRVTAGEFKDK